MSNPNPPGGGGQWSMEKTAGDGEATQLQSRPQFGEAPPYGQPEQPAQYGQPAGYGQPQYGQYAPQAYQPQQVPAGYFPVINSQGQQVLVPLATPGKRFLTQLLEGVLCIATLFIGYFVWLLIAWGKGQTPGKQVTKLKYVDANTGQVCDWGKSAMRDFVIRGIVIGFISAITLYIGFLVAAFMIFDKDKQYKAGWDRMAGTVVVDVSNVQL